MTELGTGDAVRDYLRHRSNWGRWGEDDELGTINLITAEKRLHALAGVRTGRTVSLAGRCGAKAWGARASSQTPLATAPSRQAVFSRTRKKATVSPAVNVRNGKVKISMRYSRGWCNVFRQTRPPASVTADAPIHRPDQTVLRTEIRRIRFQSVLTKAAFLPLHR